MLHSLIIHPNQGRSDGGGAYRYRPIYPPNQTDFKFLMCFLRFPTFLKIYVPESPYVPNQISGYAPDLSDDFIV